MLSQLSAGRDAGQLDETLAVFWWCAISCLGWLQGAMIFMTCSVSNHVAYDYGLY